MDFAMFFSSFGCETSTNKLIAFLFCHSQDAPVHPSSSFVFSTNKFSAVCSTYDLDDITTRPKNQNKEGRRGEFACRNYEMISHRCSIQTHRASKKGSRSVDNSLSHEFLIRINFVIVSNERLDIKSMILFYLWTDRLNGRLRLKVLSCKSHLIKRVSVIYI